MAFLYRADFTLQSSGRNGWFTSRMNCIFNKRFNRSSIFVQLLPKILYFIANFSLGFPDYLGVTNQFGTPFAVLFVSHKKLNWPPFWNNHAFIEKPAN